MASRWELSNELQNKYIPIVQAFIDKIESEDEDESSELDLSDTGLSPYTMQKLLEGMGYEEKDVDTNGWQWDFWITMTKEGFKPLCLSGTGITFTMQLSRQEE